MNNGLYGFPPGKNITVDTQEYERSDVWTKPRNAQLCFIEATGGGEAGSNGGTGANGTGGAAGVAYQIVVPASLLEQTETVTIGAGGASNGADGGDTIFSSFRWEGGLGGNNARYGYIPVASSSGFGSSATGEGVGGRHGNFGAGAGGAGGGSTLADGGAGGKPRTFEFASASGVTANTGGGAAGGFLGQGSAANPLNDRHGFGEGGGGGSYNGSGAGFAGGNGRRGSGGGGGGMGLTSGGTGGRGGDGFLRITTYCWEG